MTDDRTDDSSETPLRRLVRSRRVMLELSRVLGIGDNSNLPIGLLDRVAQWEALHRWLADRVRDRRVIFCINPGRSGSGYLAQLLAAVPGARCHHEAKPAMSGKYLRLVNEAPLADSYQVRSFKRLVIGAELLRHPDAPFYCETNHMFIKTFHDVVVDFFDKLEVIVLRRNPAAVLRSMVEMRWFSPDVPTWRRWADLPGRHTRLTRPIAPLGELDPFDRAIAYMIEIEARAQRFLELHPAIAVHEAQLEELVEADGARKLFSSLGVPWSDEADRRRRARVNARPDIKVHYGRTTSLEHCEERIASHVQEARRLGIPVPGIMERQ